MTRTRILPDRGAIIIDLPVKAIFKKKKQIFDFSCEDEWMYVDVRLAVVPGHRPKYYVHAFRDSFISGNARELLWEIPEEAVDRARDFTGQGENAEAWRYLTTFIPKKQMGITNDA
jgi:hypothetical protein